MKIAHSLKDPFDVKKPIMLTIGFFDGVHRGHQAVIKQVKKLAEEKQGSAVVLTFEQHPFTVLHPEKALPPICSLEKKLELLEKLGVDLTIVLPFTHEFSKKSAEQFLTELRRILPFSYLNMGYNGAIGKDREGNREVLQKLAQDMNFELEYAQPVSDEGIISSTRIRKLLQDGRDQDAEKLLGWKNNS